MSCQRCMRCRLHGRTRGQGLMEYVVIAALVAIAAIGVYAAFGRVVRDQAAGLAQGVAGKPVNGSRAMEAANAAGGRANNPQKEGMSQYNYDNDGT